jgi:pyruvate dehydrogenase E2 component (dihydrolipoamide acetyltransferase)
VSAPAVQPVPPLTPSIPEEVAHLRVSPAARRLAQLHAIDLATVKGTGPHGAIIRADIERRMELPPLEKKRGVGLDLDAMRVAIAAAMARSKREIPHYYLRHDIDITPSEEWLARANASREPQRRLLMGALTLKAVGIAARRFPAFNGFYREGRFEASPGVHTGVAIAIRGGGLASPALHGVDQLALDELMSQLRDLIQRTRTGRIRSSEMTDATITVSSLGDRGVDALFGIIYPPQVALVGFGKPTRRPWIVNDTIAPRSVMTATLAADHRVSDGHAGALFLSEIGKLLQEPEKL